MDQDRIAAVADALAEVGFDGIAAFDRTEPEYATLKTLFDRFDADDHVILLAALAATQDYQLNGDAQAFWRELERTATDYNRLNSTQTVRDLLDEFMTADVNARLNQQKRDRLAKIYGAGFDRWFVDEYDQVEPVVVWNRLADALDNPMQGKTVVLAMKIYDIANLLRHGEYLPFPSDIPIPCDLQVERVTQSAGISISDDTSVILEAWAEVMDGVEERLGEPVSLLRIDSVVWQAGQIIGHNEPDREAARGALEEHFEEVGIDEAPAERLAQELTAVENR